MTRSGSSNPSFDSQEIPQDDRSIESCSIGRLPVCPVCGGDLIDIRMKRQCSRCHTICETCCEGGRG